MPRPLSTTVMELSAWTVTWISVQKPAMASSTEVVNDLPHQVMQTAGARRADIHARALTNGLETFENLNPRRHRNRFRLPHVLLQSRKCVQPY